MEGTLASASGDDGFFSDIEAGIGSGISRIGSEILPIWAERQLVGQQKDQLSQPTFNAAAAPPRNNDALRTVTGPAVTGSTGGIPNVFFWIGGALGLVLIGAFFLRGR